MRRQPRCHALPGRLEGTATGGRTWRRTRYRRSLLRQERYAQDQAWRIQTGFHTDTQRPGFDRADGELMSTGDSSAGSNTKRLYGKYRGLVVENIARE